MDITGRVLHGLDEFKLRLGHLSVICLTAKYEGGSSHRLEKDVIANLTESVHVSELDRDNVGQYLFKKKLCPDFDVQHNGNSKPRQYRYPQIAYQKLDSTSHFNILPVQPSEKAPKIWFQDLCLAQSTVLSHVGAVTVGGKSSSKTGVSHILDWARELDLISKSGIASPIAEIVAHKIRANAKTDQTYNPYCLGMEKIALGYSYIWMDFDIFTELIAELSEETGLITKKRATAIYIEAASQLTNRAESSANLSGRQTRPIYLLWRDLEKAKKRSRADSFVTSTAWHRASSRFETLTDLGFLTKTTSDQDNRFEYKYRRTDLTKLVAESLTKHESSADWFGTEFVSSLLGVETAQTTVSPDILQATLPTVVEALQRPTSPLPMTAVVLGIAVQLAEGGTPYSLRAIQTGLRELAAGHPDLARLSKGSRAESAGMISIDINKLEEAV